MLCSEVEHKLDGEGPWILPDGSEDCQIIFTPGHTEAHCVLLYKPQKVWKLTNMRGPLVVPAAGSRLQSQKLSHLATPTSGASQALLASCGSDDGCPGQVLFSGDHLAADSVAEWNARFETNDDGFLGISRNFNCESLLQTGTAALWWMHRPC